jgi:alkylation response protein AidB-like acyl-CoA dehydrogenase
MLLDPTPDQEFFRETTDRFLREQMPVGELRRLRDDPAGFSPDYWRRGAELGWTSLLVSEANGGGSISGAGIVDLTLVAHEFGRHAAPGPLVTTNIVASALDALAADRHADLLGGIVAGTAIASWCATEPRDTPAGPALPVRIRVDGNQLVIDGSSRPVESAGAASHLLVTGADGESLTQVLVPVEAPGVRIEPLTTVDLTRRFSRVTFDDVRLPLDAALGEVGRARDQVAAQRRLAAVIGCAESVGAMQAAFDMTVEWAFDRYSFGRPLASYQELKHRFADMKTWLEASHAIADEAAMAVAAGSSGAPELVGAAKSFIGDYGSELLQDCVQIHGGIGLTYEHDLHLFLRRHTVDRALYGTPASHRREITTLLEGQEAAA